MPCAALVAITRADFADLQRHPVHAAQLLARLSRRVCLAQPFLGFAIAGCNTMNPVGRLDRDTPGQGTWVVQGQADVTGELWPVVTEPQEQPGQLAKTGIVYIDG